MMNEQMKAKLQTLASDKCWSDEEDFEVDDYAGGNVDDAYDFGRRDGVIALARELLKEFGDN